MRMGNASYAARFAGILSGLLLLTLCIGVAPGYADQITLEWDAPTTNADGSVFSDGDHFVLYKNGVAQTPIIPWTQDSDNNGSPDASLSGVLDGDIFEVTAVDHAGNESGKSNSVTYTDTLAPAACGNLRIK